MNIRRTASSGFSLVELLTVLGITMVIAAMALPNLISAAADFRLRSKVSSAAGMLQQARMEAVRRNTARAVRTAAGPAGTTRIYADFDNSATFSAGDPSFLLPQGFSLPTSGAPGTLPASLAYSVNALGSTPGFNPRGLPCISSGTACNNTANGFVFYFMDTRPLGPNGWAALTVSPAGRVRTWAWSGTAWQ